MRRLRGALLDPPPPGALVGIAWRPQQRLDARDDFLAILRESVTLIDERQVLPFVIPTTKLKRTARLVGSAVGGA
uniref:hypothetical protein n=1 Tax=Bosea sp. (in: a-proteobacteria) TaxID=1871050 RepID=UPI0025B8342E